MWVIIVVILHPILSEGSCLFYIFKAIRIQYIFPKGFVEPFTKSVLHRLSFLYSDMPDRGVGAKALKSFCDELRSIIRADICWFSMPVNEPFYKLNHFLRRKTIIYFTH